MVVNKDLVFNLIFTAMDGVENGGGYLHGNLAIKSIAVCADIKIRRR